MALITIILLGALSLLYISKGLKSKPDFITKAVDFIAANIEWIALWGIIFALVAMLVTPFSNYFAIDVFSRIFANLMIIVLALPFSLEKMLAKAGDKMNEALAEVLRDITAAILRYEKTIGIVGACAAAFLFAVVFR